MKPTEYISHDGLGLAELIRNGEISQAEALDCALGMAELLNPQINTIVELFPEPLAGTQRADAPFFGVPFLIKDLALHAEGVLNEMCSRLSLGIRAQHDTDLMQRFRRAGLRTIGRAAIPEFGYCITTESLVNGPSRNPWDLTRTPGGSSGATAASVAAGIVPFAHANDGGGSIRIPASCCGLVGLKPTRGRVPVGPDNAELLSGLAVEFAVTRTVRDAAALLDAVNGPGIGDPFEIPSPGEPYASSAQKDPGALKIACMSEAWSGVHVDAQVKNTIPQTAQLCADLGHHVVEASPELDWEQFLEATVILWIANLAVFIDYAVMLSGRPADEEHLEATTLACYREGKQVKAETLLRAQIIANQICRNIGRFFQEYDILLTPAMAQPPLPLGVINANDPSLDARAWSSRIFEFCPFTPLFNMTGQPAVSLPLQRSAADLPLGVQFVGRYGAETTLLQLARQLEQAAPWPLTAPLLAQRG
ncbi:MAG: amidase [Gammaproteobacteria bacterium]|nr:amidase [Gammaproteobacteria bacterium]